MKLPICSHPILEVGSEVITKSKKPGVLINYRLSGDENNPGMALVQFYDPESDLFHQVPYLISELKVFCKLGNRVAYIVPDKSSLENLSERCQE